MQFFKLFKFINICALKLNNFNINKYKISDNILFNSSFNKQFLLDRELNCNEIDNGNCFFYNYLFFFNAQM